MDMHNPIEVSPDHQRVADLVKATIAERGLTQSEIARQADMSAATLSAFLLGRYKGDNEEIARKLLAWHGRFVAGDALTVLIDRLNAYVPTPTSRKVTAALDFAKSIGAIGAVAGTSGIGKTSALKHYATEVPAVWYCEFSEDTTSVYSALAEVAFALGMTDLPNRPDELRRAIVTRVKGTRGLLICDEAQHLKDKGFEAIRTIHDRGGIGIVFAGHLDLMDKLKRLPQIAGRVSAPVRIGAAVPADVEALLAGWGFDCKHSRQFLRQYAGQSTGLRRIANAFRLAATFAAGQGSTVTVDHIRQAWTALAGSIAAQ